MTRDRRLFLVLADKGGKLVVWKCEHYLAEAHRQLTGSYVCDEVNEDTIFKQKHSYFTWIV